MKLLHVISSANPLGGGPIEGVKQLGAAVQSQGHSVQVVSLDSPSEPFLNDIPLSLLPLGPTIGKYRFSLKLVPWLRANCRRYDAIIVNGIWQYHSFATWKSLRRSGVPYYVYTHGMLDPWFKRTFPFKHLKKLAYWNWAEHRVLRDARGVLFTSDQERLLAKESFSKYLCKEHVVNYGTAEPSCNEEAEISAFFAENPALRGKRIVLFLGRVHPKKGCDLVIQAFAEVFSRDHEWHLVIAGPDQVGWTQTLKRMARQLGISHRTTWRGLTSGEPKWGAIRAAEVLLLPSHQENFGIVVAEALACGTPVLISDQVNIWREVSDAGAGIVAKDNLAGTIQLLTRWKLLSACDQSLMRAKARELFIKRFEIKMAAKSLIDVISQQ